MSAAIDLLQAILVGAGRGRGIEKAVNGARDIPLGGDDLAVEALFGAAGQGRAVEVKAEGVDFAGGFPLHQHLIALKDGGKRDEMDGSSGRAWQQEAEEEQSRPEAAGGGMDQPAHKICSQEADARAQGGAQGA